MTVTATWNGIGTDWFNADAWNEPNPNPPPPVIHYVPGSNNDVTFSNAGPYTVTYNGTDTVNSIGGAQQVTLAITGGSLTVVNGGELGALTTAANTGLDLDNDLFTLVGSVSNAGTIALNSTGDLTRLTFGLQTTSSPVTLTGGGAITLSDSTGNNIFIDNSASLDNVDNTISGGGSITSNFTSLTNEAAGVIDATGTNSGLIVNVPTVTNRGLLEDTGTGGLQLSGGTIANAGGTILAAGSGAHVDVSNGTTIRGGTLTTSGGGVIQIATGGDLLDGSGANGPVTITAGSLVRLNDNTSVTLAGSPTNTGVIVNHGTIALNSTGDLTKLNVGFQTTSSPVSLTGGGAITLSDSANNNIFIDNSASLDNVDNTISGGGSITSNFSSLTNEAAGVIDATGTNSGLLLGVPTISNKGLLEDTGTGGLQLSGDTIVNGGGTILAAGAGAHVDISNGTAIQGGTVEATDSGLVKLDGSVVLDGSTAAGAVKLVIDGNSTLELGEAVASSQTVTFSGTGGDLLLDSPGRFDGSVTNFAAGDTIDLSGEAVTSVSYDGATATVTLANGSQQTFQVSGSADRLTTASDGHGGTLIEATPCYARGTRILTERGEVAVEDLAVGDRVVLASGGRRPVVWLGHRATDCSTHPEPQKVWPVCVAAGAFGEGLPVRDLWLSPDHCVAMDGALIPVKALLNGRTIAQHRRPRVEYWHVELDRHDVILAEGLPAESYLDTGNRAAFANGGAFVEAHPDFAPRHGADTGLPLVMSGRRLERVRSALKTRTEALGCRLVAEADPHLVADGQAIEPRRLGESRIAFALPPDCARIALRSRLLEKAAVGAGRDGRSLGLCITRMKVDGVLVPLDQGGFGVGWHAAERLPDGSVQRWTDGEAALPAGARHVVLDLGAEGLYWDEPESNAVALTA